MPLMATYEQSDARDAARVLATMTLDGLRTKVHERRVGNAMNNMYRLLLDYRSHGFYGYAGEPRHEDDSSLTSLMTSADRNVGDLKIALDEAFQTAFGNTDTSKVIDDIKGVLRMSAYPQEGDLMDPSRIKKAENFLEVFLEKLQA